MKEIIKQILHDVGEVTVQLVNGTASIVKRSYEQQQQQYQQYQQQCQQQYALNIMECLRYDMYQALQGHNYNLLSPINVATDIRLQSYQVINNQIFFIFALDKINAERIPPIILNNFMQKMNADLMSSTRQIQRQNMVDSSIGFMFPYLLNGIQLVDIKDFGGLEVLIRVRTNYLP